LAGTRHIARFSEREACVIHGLRARLAKFMEAVDDVTGAMRAAEPADLAPAEPAPEQGDAEPAVEEAPSDPWAAPVDAGLQLVAALSQRSADGSVESVVSIEHDPRTGRDVIKLPLPLPQTVQRLAEALIGLLAASRHESQAGRTRSDSTTVAPKASA
jgi:hypothetical protein